MEKDIDDLLDEVESQFVKKGSGKGNSTSATSTSLPQQTSGNRSHSNHSQKRSQIDDAIDDILDLDLNSGSSSTQDAPQSYVRAVPSQTDSVATKKCFPTFLGGSTEENGRSTTVNNRTCDQLRCTACDFRVSFFDDFSWQKDTSYLFLRNNVPDFHKLKSKLSRKKAAVLIAVSVHGETSHPCANSVTPISSGCVASMALNTACQ